VGKRRGRFEGSIYKRGSDGLWVGQLYVNGKKKVKYGKTQKIVREWLHDQKEAVNKGTFIDAKDVTLSAFLESYMASQEASLRPKTVNSYQYLIKNHINPDLGSVKLSQLRPDMVQAFYTNKVNSGLSKRTVQYMHAVLHKSLDQAMKWGLVVRNVTDLVDPPSPAKKSPVTWTVEQSKQFLEQVKGSRFYPMYCLAYIGLREGEILGLSCADFNKNAHTITIHQSLQYLPGKGLVISEPKTEASKRTIKLPDFVYEALCAHPLKENQKLMFVTSANTPFSPRNFFRDFKDQTKAAGLPEIRFHDLRHFAVSFLVNELKIPPKVVQGIIGHTTINLTMTVYAHSTTDQQDEAMEKMGEAFKT
jgi:integrase